MKLALAQLHTINYDFEGNFNKILGISRRAQEMGADLLVLSPSTSYEVSFAYLNEEQFYDEYNQAFKDFQKNLSLPVVMTVYVDELSTRFALVSSNNIELIPAETSTFDFMGKTIFYSETCPDHLRDDFDDDMRETYELITELDIENLEYPDIVIYSDNQSFSYDVSDDSQEPLNTVDLEIVINTLTLEDEWIQYGDVRVYKKDLGLIVQGDLFSEGIIFLDTEKSYERTNPKETTGFNNLFKALSFSIKSFIFDQGFKQVLVGLSGGMDSSLVATLAVHALGADNVLGLIMPSKYTSQESLEDAQQLADNLGIKTKSYKIDEAHNLLSSMGELEAGSIADQNVQARVRGLLLMLESNKTGAIVLNTSNKSEAAMGYSTLYGDTVGSFSPLADVYKTDVYKLAKEAENFFDTNPIPECVFTKPASAELADSQSDEESLGESYDIIDQVLRLHLKQEITVKEIAKELNVDYERVAKILNRLVGMEFKRKQEPKGPNVSEAPLSYLYVPQIHKFRY